VVVSAGTSGSDFDIPLPRSLRAEEKRAPKTVRN
jgi:hypothetical protein